MKDWDLETMANLSKELGENQFHLRILKEVDIDLIPVHKI